MSDLPVTEAEVVPTPPTPVNDKLTAERIAEVQEVFSFFDKDADGCVTIDNLGPLIRSIGYNPSESDLRFLTASLRDEGKDDLEFVDFLGIIPKIQRSGETEAELIEAFQVFDKDGTGRIGTVELRHVITNLGEKLSEDEADEMMRFADETSQGEISYKELIQLLLA